MPARLAKRRNPRSPNFFRRLLGDLFEAFADGLLGELTDQASENLLDDGPRGGNRRGGGGGCRARGEHHRDPKADQLADQDAELDPDFDFAASMSQPHSWTICPISWLMVGRRFRGAWRHLRSSATSWNARATAPV